MNPDKKPEEKDKEQTAAPADGAKTEPAASAPTPDAPGEETVDATTPMSAAGAAAAPTKKVAAPEAKAQNGLKLAIKKFRLYVLIILFVIVIAAVFLIVSSLNKRKTPPPPAYQSQTLTQSELQQLSTSNETVGGSSETLNVQGNTDLTGNELVKGSLNVAGTIQSGSQFTLQQVKVSGNSTINTAQLSSLQVANGVTFGGLAGFQSGMNVAGNISFTNLSAASLTDTDLTLSSNADIQGHVSFSPPENATPYRQVSFGVLGNGGSASIFGTDEGGTASINTGNNPLPGCFMTVIFNTPYTNMPNILISPVGYGAGASKYYVIPTTKSFKICTNNAAPPNQAFAFDYFIGATPN